MITRNPAAAMRRAWPNLIQFICASENSPWSRITGRPSPGLVPGELDAVGRGPMVEVQRAQLGHGLPVAFAHRSTSG